LTQRLNKYIINHALEILLYLSKLRKYNRLTAYKQGSIISFVVINKETRFKNETQCKINKAL